jgi:hypothetical protein
MGRRTTAMNGLQQFYEEVVAKGSPVCPRGMDARALHNTTFDFVPGQVFTRPGMNMDIGFIELLQWINGTFSIKPFERYAPKAHLELFTYTMAYGPRTKDQFQAVIDVLNQDGNTRRAVVMVARTKDKPEELPCTLSLQFILNNIGASIRTLHTIVTMRSNDLVWGLPTDIIQFGGIAQMVASCTSSISTSVVVNCGDSHVYDATRLKEGEQFKLAGTFSIPSLYTLDAYKDWATKALSQVRGIQKPRYACEYVPEDEGTVETA